MGRGAKGYTIDEAAAELDAPPSIVRRLVASRAFPRVGEVDGEPRIPESDLRAFLGRRVEPHFSQATVAGLLDCTPRHVRRLIQAGTLPVRHIAGLPRIAESDLLALIPRPA